MGKQEQKPKKNKVVLWCVVAFLAFIFLHGIYASLTKEDSPQQQTQQQVETAQPVAEQPAGLKCEDIIADKVGYIYDYTECVQATTTLSNMSQIISEFTKCSTEFMSNYYDKTVVNYSCTDAEMVSINHMDQMYTTYTNCITNIKTDYNVDMEGAFTEISQCYANFVTSFNNRLSK